MREPSPQELELMDQMISKLASSEVYELPNAISRSIRVVSSPQFFMRIAELADGAEGDEKERLAALATNLVSTLEAIVSTADDRMNEKAKNLEEVLKAASEPDSGEFLVPLSGERVEAMRNVMEELDPVDLDEGFLVTVDGWMNKSMEDGMDGMVGILQKVLQMYAAIAIAAARKTLQAEVGAALVGKDPKEALEQEEKPASAMLEKILEVDTDLWDGLLKEQLEDFDKESLLGEVQRTIEGVVLGLENGSMAQRVQAEFLRELVIRIESV